MAVGDIGRLGQIVGREAELAALRDFVESDAASGAVVLTGGAGIGKTTLWEAAAGIARERGLRVLVARPTSAEAHFSFAALGDLLDDIEPEALDGLPEPQRHALDVALLRAQPDGAPPEARAIAVGLTTALRGLSAREPLLVAVDDVQWLDQQSADALAFAARRLQGDPVRFLLARRARSAAPIEQALDPALLRRVELGPLGLGATRRILSQRLGLVLPRRVLRQIVEAAHGHPLFALELGRTLREEGAPEIGEDLVVPAGIEDLVGDRLERLPAGVRRLVLAVALSADPRMAQLAAIAEPGEVDDALDAGVLRVAGDRVRLSHPLLGAAAQSRAGAAERRALHRELAGVVAGEQRRARHLALAAAGADPELAVTVAAAAAGAAARGAAEQAVELAEHALRLTPPDAAERPDRLLALAQHFDAAGEPHRVTELLEPALDSLPPGAARMRAHLLLADGGGVTHVDQHAHHLERALAEGGDDPVLRAPVLALKARHTAIACVERLDAAEAWALEALPAAGRAGPAGERPVLHVLAWVRSLRGRPVDDLRERYAGASVAAFRLDHSLDLVAGIRLAWEGLAGESRAVLRPMAALADQRGEGASYAELCLHLCELELRTGDWREAARVLDDLHDSTDAAVFPAPVYERCRALLAAGRGDPEEAERWVVKTLAGFARSGVQWDRLEALRARGIAAILAHDPQRAADTLRDVWEHTQREGVENPGTFPVAPELVEALAELGALDEARAVTDRLRELAERQAHPWGLASADRCRGLGLLASQPGEAAAALEQAAAAYEALGLRFDRARSLLSLGRGQRRLKKWGAARDPLERAVAAFDEIGSTGWAERARSELARVGARRPSPRGELTPAERRVVELAVDGMANKEIARALFVTVHTVEAHLSHAYAKLGVRSRGQLAGRLSGRA